MGESDLIRLYSARLLRLASEIPHLGRLAAPTGSAMVRAPLCGSRVSVDLVVVEGRIADFAQEVQACALGQAAAAVVGGAVLGRSRDEIARARAELARMLADDGPVPAPPFDGLEALIPARGFPNRHASILLALDATLAAMA